MLPILLTLITLVSPNAHTKDLQPELSPTPKVFTLNELRQNAYYHSFESQVELEHVFQARLTLKASRLNLLPHLSANSLTPAITGNQVGVLSAIGDIAPFLLPNRWFQVRENRFRSEAEQDTLMIVRADAGFQVELIALSILRDQGILQKMNDELAETVIIRDELQFREQLGQFQPGVHDDVTSLIIQLQKSIDILTEAVREEYSILAQSSGFVDANIIAGVQPLSPEELETPMTTNDDSSIETILKNAYELKQIDHLISAVRASRGERWTTWLDPYGDPNGGLGFALPTYVKIASSQTNEMKIRRTQMESILTQKLRNITLQMNLAVKLFNESLVGREVQKKRVNRMSTNIRMGASFALSDLINAHQDEIRNELDLINSQYDYLMSKAALNRLKMSGPYLLENLQADRSN